MNQEVAESILRWDGAWQDMVILSGCLRAKCYLYEIYKWPRDYRAHLAPAATTQMQFLAPLKAGDHMEQLLSH